MSRLIVALLLASALAACDSKNATSQEAEREEQTTEVAQASGDLQVESDSEESAGEDVKYPYAAIVSCSTSSFQTDLMVCFAGSSSRPDTNLELKNGDEYDMYQPGDLINVGRRTSEGVRIELSRNFELTMQNASESMLLGVKIVNNIPSSDFDKVIYEKKVGEFGVINVSN